MDREFFMFLPDFDIGWKRQYAIISAISAITRKDNNGILK